MKRLLIACITLGALCAMPTSAAAQATRPTVEQRALREALRRYRAHEPSVRETVRRALRAHGSDPARAQTLADRARWSGLMPAARVGARRGLGWDLSQLQSTDAGRVQLGTADQLSLYAELSFDLDRLVYSREEAGLLREQRARQDARRQLIAEVVHIYFERRRLMLERDLLGKRDLEQILRIEEATALLEAYTGATFRRGRGEPAMAR